MGTAITFSGRVLKVKQILMSTRIELTNHWKNYQRGIFLLQCDILGILAKEDPAGVASFRTMEHQRTAMTVLVDRLNREEIHLTKVSKLLVYQKGWICTNITVEIFSIIPVCRYISLFPCFLYVHGSLTTWENADYLETLKPCL